MIKAAVIGYGVVGSGAVEVFYKNYGRIVKKLGEDMDIKYILDLRDFSGTPYDDKFIKDFEIILNDPEITVVVEAIGGLEPSYGYVRSLLEAGKSVVTPNKELVAQKGAELLETAREKNVNFLFEASVGGGIPIIEPICQSLFTNRVDEVVGILNGTTNFILTKMIDEKMDFSEALALAQSLGYAERNPYADVDGIDTCRKICILASLLFGKKIYPESVYTEGISEVMPEDVGYCENYGGVIKLIGRAKRNGDKAAVMVCPAFVKKSNQLAGVNDVFNAILLKGDAVGDVLFYGKGAGKLPTGSAIVSDMITAAVRTKTDRSLYWEDCGDSFAENYKNLESSFYLRLLCEDKPKAVNLAKKLFGNISILNRENEKSNEFAFITEKINEGEFEKLCGQISKTAQIRSKIRVLDY